jgi:adenosylcobinamide-GDP ribazoletransferase
LILLPVTPFQLAAAFIMMILCPVILLKIAEHCFGGVNGDIVGASNEISRALIVVAIAVL